MTIHRDTDITLQTCEACGGEGQIYHADGSQSWDFIEICEECEGTGAALIPCELIELEDLEIA